MGRIVDSKSLPPWYRGVVKFHVLPSSSEGPPVHLYPRQTVNAEQAVSRILFPMFAGGFDPIRRTKDDSVAASNHDIVKEERNEMYSK